MMIIVIMMMIASYTKHDDHHNSCTMLSSSWWRSSSFVYDAIIMMAIIIIHVRCNHHHDDDHNQSCTMQSSSLWRSSSTKIIASYTNDDDCHPTPRIQLSVRPSVRPHFWHASYKHASYIVHTRVRCCHHPERPKGAKDEVKQAQRATN